MKYNVLILIMLFGLLTGLAAQQLAPVDQGAQFLFGSSPGGSAEIVVLKAIGSAKVSIEGVIYTLTNTAIAEAFIVAMKRGVTVRLVADAKAAGEKYSLISKLRRAGISVRLDSAHAITHHKMMIIDRKSIELGSFNWTSGAAKRNAEDAIWLVGVPSIVAQASAVWQECWDESK